LQNGLKGLVQRNGKIGYHDLVLGQAASSAPSLGTAAAAKLQR